MTFEQSLLLVMVAALAFLISGGVLIIFYHYLTAEKKQFYSGLIGEFFENFSKESREIIDFLIKEVEKQSKE